MDLALTKSTQYGDPKTQEKQTYEEPMATMPEKEKDDCLARYVQNDLNLHRISKDVEKISESIKNDLKRNKAYQ